MTSAMRMD